VVSPKKFLSFSEHKGTYQYKLYCTPSQAKVFASLQLLPLPKMISLSSETADRSCAR